MIRKAVMPYMAEGGDVGSLTVRVGMDNAGFTSGMQAINRQLRVVTSEFRASSAMLTGYGNNTDQLRLRSQSLARQLEIHRQKVNMLADQYARSVQETGADARATRELEIQLNNARRAMANIENEIVDVNRQIQTQESNWTALGTRLSSIGSAMTKVGDKMKNAGKSMSTFVTAPLLGAGYASFKLASDVNESLNKVDVAFGDSANAVKEWSNTTLDKFGIAQGSALDMSATFGDMGTSMGLSQEKASEMSQSLVGLAGDLSSFKNIGIEESQTALTGIFTGETESLKRLGVVMLDSTLQQYALSKGIKTKLQNMTQDEKVLLRYNYVMEKTKNAHGDFARTQGGAANQQRIFTEGVKELGASFGQHILPVVTPIIKKINDMVKSFGKLDDKTKKTILVIAGIAAAIGPALVIMGTLVSSVGSIVSAFGAMSAAIGAAGGASAVFGGALAVITGPIGLTIGAIALLTAGGIALYRHMKQDSIPAVKLFGKETSESTKKAVGSYMELNDKASSSLMDLKIRGTKVSKETANTLVGNFNTMGKQIKDGMNASFDKTYEKMGDFFASSSALSKEEEMQILQNMEKSNADKVKSVDDYTNRIKQIMTKAKEEKRSLTEKEQQEITEIQESMKITAVKTLSATELESKAILERMKSQASNLTARQAADVVKNSKTQKDKAVKNAESQYNETVKAIIKQRDETGTISKSQADKLLAEAKKQRDGAVKKAQDMHKTVVSEAKKQAKGHSDQVNWETGQVLSKWQVFKNNVGKKFNEIVSNTKAKISQTKTDIVNGYEQAKQKAIAKVSEIKSNLSRKWEEIKSSASSKMNQVKDAIWSPIEKAKNKISEIIATIKGFFSNLKLSLPKFSAPKMPHFELEYSSKTVFGKTFQYPSGLGVNWYDTGGIFNSPQIIGVGERRPEFVGALDDLRLLIRDELIKDRTSSNQNNNSGGQGKVINQTNNFYSPTALNQAEINRLTKKETQKLQLLLGAEV